MHAPRQVRILVLRGGALGDFIVTLPALAALRGQWPDAYIEILGYPHIAALARRGGLADRVTSLHGAQVARFFSLRPDFPPEQVAFVRSFDLIVNYLHDPDGTVAGHLEQIGARQVLRASPLVTAGHAVDHLLKPLESLALYAAGAVPRLALPEADREGGRRLLAACNADPARTWIIHPGSGSPTKNWPEERFVALARRMRGEGRGQPVFLTGEADESAARHLGLHAADLPHVSNRSLDDVACFLSACAGYVGNDSGITHLAAALGRPTLALFGPSQAEHWAPRGSHVTVQRAPGGDLGMLTVDAVWSALSPLFAAG